MFPSLEEMVDTAAEAAGVTLPEEMLEEESTVTKNVSKSARVREYLEKDPEARNKDVSIALSQYGVKAADVANVKANLRKKAEKGNSKSASKTTTAAKAKASAADTSIDASIQLDLLETGIEFVRQAGGINEAVHVLGVIRRIRSL